MPCSDGARLLHRSVSLSVSIAKSLLHRTLAPHSCSWGDRVSSAPYHDQVCHAAPQVIEGSLTMLGPLRWKESQGLTGPVLGADTNQDYLYCTVRTIPSTVRQRANEPPRTLCGVFSRDVVGAEGQCKADVCAYAVTSPLIQLSKLLSDATDRQGFQSDVLDTQTLCLSFTLLHASQFCER